MSTRPDIDRYFQEPVPPASARVNQFDGNADQIRAMIAQSVEATLVQRGGIHEDLEALKNDLERQVDTKIDAAVTKMKFWVISAVLTQILAMLPVIFFLGGIYSTNNAALAILEKQQAILEKRGAWMTERERVEQALEQWAEPKGYVPPRYRSAPE